MKTLYLALLVVFVLPCTGLAADKQPQTQLKMADKAGTPDYTEYIEVNRKSWMFFDLSTPAESLVNYRPQKNRAISDSHYRAMIYRQSDYMANGTGLPRPSSGELVTVAVPVKK